METDEQEFSPRSVTPDAFSTPSECPATESNKNLILSTIKKLAQGYQLDEKLPLKTTWELSTNKATRRKKNLGFGNFLR